MGIWRMVGTNGKGLLDRLSLILAPARLRQTTRSALRPAVRIEDSVTPNFLVCLETGSRQVLLKRHLRETLRMTPEEYRDRWGLPPEYPMVAESYQRRRKAVRQAERHG